MKQFHHFNTDHHQEEPLRMSQSNKVEIQDSDLNNREEEFEEQYMANDREEINLL